MVCKQMMRKVGCFQVHFNVFRKFVIGILFIIFHFKTNSFIFATLCSKIYLGGFSIKTNKNSMENNLETSKSQYQLWFTEWKSKIQSAQIKAALRVNTELLTLYWELGRDIVTQQETTA
jgi:hypothetical protein